MTLKGWKGLSAISSPCGIGPGRVTTSATFRRSRLRFPPVQGSRTTQTKAQAHERGGEGPRGGADSVAAGYRCRANARPSAGLAGKDHQRPGSVRNSPSRPSQLHCGPLAKRQPLRIQQPDWRPREGVAGGERRTKPPGRRIQMQGRFTVSQFRLACKLTCIYLAGEISLRS